MAPSKSLLPKGYTFLVPNCMVLDTADALYQDLCKKADNRCPDFFNMYIYNDYFSYGTLDLIDSTLSTVHGKVIKKDWSTAFNLLEAVTLFISASDQWTNCDDGERVKLTNKVYGSLLVTVLRALKKADRLDTTHFPSLEYLLRNAADWGDEMDSMSCPSNYNRICRAIGWRLFNGKLEENQILEKGRFVEWKNKLSQEELEQLKAGGADNDDDGEDEDDEDDVDNSSKKIWYNKGKDEDEDAKYKDLVLSRLWKEYKDHLRGFPNVPLRGPPIWDLTEWSHEEKKPFLFSEMD
ncbi:hypothetical protein BDZ94DRAFT_1256618 [Collybia nuda]|uniref:Uncharacterized protein n=1 Tax=Collybia nuda TaxID=64659 RepID=A0A9P5Y622_9AGAR|nr:hypothetical protein BDZ94DRAFT_1256618 [Collybia nuda]